MEEKTSNNAFDLSNNVFVLINVGSVLSNIGFVLTFASASKPLISILEDISPGVPCLFLSL
jgi:hypothetical protein